MTAPTAIVGAVTGGTVVGDLIQGYGQDQAQQAQAAASQYRAGVALLNKQINEQNAAWAREAGDVQTQISGLKSRQQIGETKVIQAASGFDVNTGTAANVRADQTNIAEFEQNTIRWNAAKEAYGYETKATMNQAESTLDVMSAENEQEAGQMALLGSYINAGTSVADKWMQARSIGMM